MSEDLAPRPTTGERAAALVALVSLGGALGVLLAGAASNWVAVVVTVCGLMTSVAAGWYAVARRGLRRSVAAAVAGLGAGALVVGLAVADGSLATVTSALALAGLSVATARVALRRSPRALRRAARSRTPAPPARHPVLIINPRSGGGKGERFKLVDECRARGIEPIVLQVGDDLLQLAHDAIARGADVIGMAGGDGSQALVATAASSHDVAHVVVPAGTRNHFALDIGLDRDDVVGALDAFHDGHERRVDLAEVNGRVFVNNASVGLYAKIVQSPGYRDAKGRTALATLPDLLGPDAEPLDLRFTGPDGKTHPTAHVIMVSNDPYTLHTLVGRGTREGIDNGVLGIVAVQIPTARDASRLISLEATGRADRFAGWEEWTATEFRIDSDGPVEIGVDGEALKLDPPLLFETRPRVLRVRIPRQAIGHSPAAIALHLVSHSTVIGLARVIAGRSAG